MPGSVRLGGPRPARCARAACRARCGFPAARVGVVGTMPGKRPARWAVVCSVRARGMSCSVRVSCCSVR